MMKIFGIGVIFVLLTAISLNIQAQDDYQVYIDSINAYHTAHYTKYRRMKTSPLRERAKDFQGHDWFETDTAYRVTATLELTKRAKPFWMPTSNPNRKNPYVSYGVATFALGDTTLSLTVYKSLQVASIPKYKNYYFIPFQDLTNGEETYGGGRYLDVKLEKGQTTFELDFNRCYNPYCAYADGYSCPIPPKENYLSVRIEAGIKTYKGATETAQKGK